MNISSHSDPAECQTWQKKYCLIKTVPGIVKPFLVVRLANHRPCNVSASATASDKNGTKGEDDALSYPIRSSASLVVPSIIHHFLCLPFTFSHHVIPRNLKGYFDGLLTLLSHMSNVYAQNIQYTRKVCQLIMIRRIATPRTHWHRRCSQVIQMWCGFIQFIPFQTMAWIDVSW